MVKRVLLAPTEPQHLKSPNCKSPKQLHPSHFPQQESTFLLSQNRTVSLLKRKEKSTNKAKTIAAGEKTNEPKTVSTARCRFQAPGSSRSCGSVSRGKLSGETEGFCWGGRRVKPEKKRKKRGKGNYVVLCCFVVLRCGSYVFCCFLMCFVARKVVFNVLASCVLVAFCEFSGWLFVLGWVRRMGSPPTALSGWLLSEEMFDPL